MEIQIEMQERYPDWTVVSDQSKFSTLDKTTYDVDDETVRRWERVRAEYEAVQAEIEALYNAEAEKA